MNEELEMNEILSSLKLKVKSLISDDAFERAQAMSGMCRIISDYIEEYGED